MPVISRPLTVRDRAGPLAPHRRPHLIPITLLAYALALLALVALVQTVIVWTQRRLDDLRYGFPRTVTLEALVGHNEAQGLPTIMEALNLHGQIVIVEFPGGDIGATRLLPGPYLVGRTGSYTVPHLALDDADGDGHVDLLLTLDGETVVYLNRDGAFQPPSPETLAALR
jgi:hypothetical protein